MLDFSKIEAGLTGQSYIDFLRTWDFNDEEAAIILLDPKLQSELGRILPAATLHRFYTSNPDRIDLAQFALVRLESDLEKAPAGWGMEMGITGDLDKIYTRYKSLEMLGMDDPSERLIVARALAEEPIMQPRSLKMSQKDFRAVARNYVTNADVDAIDLDLMASEMSYMISVMNGKFPPRSASQRRAYLIDFLVQDALNYQQTVRSGRNNELTIAQMETATYKAFSQYNFPPKMLEQLVNATASVFLGVPPPTTSLQKRILDRIRQFARADFRELRNLARAALAEEELATTAEAASGAADDIVEQVPNSAGSDLVVKSEPTPHSSPVRPKKRRQRQAMGRSSQNYVRNDRAPNTDVPRSRGPRPATTSADDATANSSDAATAAAKRARRPDTHPRSPISKRGIVVDANILIALQQRVTGLMDDNRAYMLANLRTLTDNYDFQSGGRAFLPDRVIKEVRDDMSVAGKYRKLKLTVKRNSPEYQAVMRHLKTRKVGIPNGETGGGMADRQIITDILFAEKSSPDVVPVFYTADSNIFKRMCEFSLECKRAGTGDDFFRDLRNGFTVTFKLPGEETVSIRIVPVPSGRGIFEGMN